jgi:xanthine dehydrogenase accessory factor
MKKYLIVIIKGAGEMASGVAWRLYQSHLQVLMTEKHAPMAVRRAVSFCEAVYDGRMTVEGVEAVLLDHPAQISDARSNLQIPLLIDPEMEIVNRLKPDVLVEATLSKKNTGIKIEDAPLVIALGPGYEAGRDAHFVIETNRGHNLGRIYTSGYAQPNTGIPGEISGFSEERVLRAPTDGRFEAKLTIGDRVEARHVVGTVADKHVIAQIPGIVRGLIRSGTMIKSGLKVGDIDPRGDTTFVATISEKARAVGGSVLEAICRRYNI